MKILCVLYDDPVGGYPTSYPRDDLPRIERSPDGQALPTPKANRAVRRRHRVRGV